MSLRVEMTIAAVTWRLLLGRRRWLLALLVNALPVIVAWLFVTQTTATAEQSVRFFLEMTSTVVLTVLMPLSGLVHGTSAFGTELDDGTLRYILAKPVARWRIVLAKLATAAAATIVSVLPGVVAAGIIVLAAGDYWVLRSFIVAVLLASVLYSALFMLLSLATRRALILGLLYVIVWEGALSRIFAGTRALSIREYAMTAAEWAGGADAAPLQAALSTTTGMLLAALMLTATTLAAISRLRVLEVAEEV